MVSLSESNKYYIVNVNSYPHFETTEWRLGIIREWGRDGKRKKLNKIKYPKSRYTEGYIRRTILPQYENCKLCNMGNLIRGKSKNFIYSKKGNNKYRNKNKSESINMLGISASKIARAAKAYFTSDTVKGQTLFGVPKFILSMFGTDLGNKIGFTIGGAALGIVNEMFNKNPTWKPIFRHGLANWMTTWADPSATQIRSMTRSVKDLVNQVRMGNYSGAFGTFVEEPEEVVGAIKEAIGSARLGGGSLGSKLGLGGGNYRDVSSVRSAEELTEVYQGEEDISPDFLQTY